jgi:L-rhamnose isomerase
MEAAGDLTGRLALTAEIRALPFGAIWDAHCLASGVPPDGRWMDEVRAYEREVLSRREARR